MVLLLQLLAITIIAPAQQLLIRPEAVGLPENASVLETRAVPGLAGKTRAVVLWMLEPTRHPREDPEMIYTCPEETSGHYFEGPTRVSLISLYTNTVINTIKIEDPFIEVGDSFRVPYLIHQGSYYLVEQVVANDEGPPTVLAFRDVNGDGRAHEFVLLEAAACMGLHTALIGYSERRDQVIQYPVNLKLSGPRDTGMETTSNLWTDYLFSMKPVSPGVWDYSIDYNGRGGCHEKYHVRYAPEAESFEGSLIASGCAE